MGAMYGKRPLPILAQKGYFMLSNGMFCVYGQMADEGLCVKELVSMQHGIIYSEEPDVQADVADDLRMLMESMIDEF